MAATGAATGGGGAPAPAAAVERVDDGTTVTLQCKDSKPIECPTVLAQQMMYIEALPKPSTGDDDDDDDDEEEGASGIKAGSTLEIFNVSAELLAQVVEFGTKNLKEAKKSPEEISRPLKTSSLTDSGVPEWAVQWITDAIKVDGKEDLNKLFDLMNASNELIYNTLTELTCAFTAAKLKDMDDKVFYATFGLTRDFTPEEEADVRASNKWVEDA